MLEEKIFKISKSRILFLAFGSFCILLIGIFVILLATGDIKKSIHEGSLLAYGSGAVCIVFFGALTFVFVKILFDNSQGIKISACHPSVLNKGYFF